MGTARLTTLVLVTVVGTASACKREPPPPPLAPSSVDAATTPVPSASAPAEDAREKLMKDVVVKWTAAINARDFAALGALHSSDVRFYGVRVDNATYLAKMKAALAKDPSFHQTVDMVHVERATPSEAKVAFAKNDGKAVHSAYLVLTRRTDGSWTIDEESDVVTDANVKCATREKLTLTGTLAEGNILWHETVTPTTVIQLSSPICVDRSPGDDWGGYAERMDGVDALTLISTITLPKGTKVRIQASHAQPHLGSGAYSTSLLVFVDSITPL